MKIRIPVLALAAALPCLAACQAIAAQAERVAITEAVGSYRQAFAEGDKALYLSLLFPGDAEFRLEQSRWFDYRLAARIEELAVSIESMEKLSPEEYAVVLHQSYLIGEEREPREVRFTRLYRRSGESWLDADLAFGVYESEHFMMRYQDTAALADVERVARDAEAAWRIVNSGYGAAPFEKTVVKLFVDRELLRQNSKITIGRLFNGWGEPGESIKLWLRPDPAYSFRSLLAHELVHKVTLTESANLCSWFAEGLANQYGSFPAYGNSMLGSGVHSPADYELSIGWLENFDPEAVDNDEDWWLYGGMAGVVVEFMASRYGHDAPRRIVQALKAWPQEREGYVWSIHDAMLRGYLAAAIEQVLDLDMAQFDAAWLAWIGAKR
ncbi:MAG: hypothetical protein E4H20_04495 [Spirochaetales bacterium]|nr:MAG: hypothetical protein E4H20_04495 [Spirochaetales bacterium]